MDCGYRNYVGNRDFFSFIREISRDAHTWSCMDITATITVSETVSVEDIRSFFTTAVIIAGALHGTPALLLTEKPAIDSKRREVRIDCSSQVGYCVAQAFIGLVAHHHGGGAVSVKREWC
jgi:hypothetical protein